VKVKSSLDHTSLSSILNGEYRLNPVLRLIEHSQLPKPQRVAFDPLATDPDHFGVLISDQIPELGVQAVDQAGAKLLSKLIQSGGVADVVSDPLELARLVLDGVLEYLFKGEFATGPAAYPALFEGDVPIQEPGDSLAEISFEALELAEQLKTTNAKEIAAWLYRFYIVPFSPIWARRLATPQVTEAFVGLNASGNLHHVLEEFYTAYDVPGWRAWRRVGSDGTEETGSLTYKLYISPHPSMLPEVFFDAAMLFVERDVGAFKMGQSAHGLLRPDKLIAYFRDYASLKEVSALLDRRLRRYKAQGVPFTASLSADGILSWGVDPPREEAIAGWQDALSWRQWITDRLGRSVLRARILGCDGTTPWQFALMRLSLDGVNTEHWLPSAVQFEKV
jgi:hypothetical protein